MKTEFSKSKNTDPTATDISIHICNKLKDYFIENGVKYCETGPMLETNTAVHSMWRHFDKRQHRRRRCYIKAI